MPPQMSTKVWPMIQVRMKPQSNIDSSGWYSRLTQLNKGYTSTSRTETFGTIVHLVKVGSTCLKLKQGSSRALQSEVDEGSSEVKAMLQDLTSVGALFPINAGNSWSL